MSFNYQKPFPFAHALLAAPGGASYVVLSSTGGDGGLAEACRLWWKLASFSVTVSGSYTTPLWYGAADTYVGNLSIPAALTPSIFYRSTSEERAAGTVFTTSTSYPASVIVTDCGCTFQIALVAGEWRLYYAFGYYGIGDGTGGGATGHPDGPDGYIDYFLSIVSDPVGTETLYFAGYPLHYTIAAGYTRSWIIYGDTITTGGETIAAPSGDFTASISLTTSFL